MHDCNVTQEKLIMCKRFAWMIVFGKMMLILIKRIFDSRDSKTQDYCNVTQNI
jgi:hypothetical protein